jgi:hypothetical protein
VLSRERLSDRQLADSKDIYQQITKGVDWLVIGVVLYRASHALRRCIPVARERGAAEPSEHLG